MFSRIVSRNGCLADVPHLSDRPSDLPMTIASSTPGRKPLAEASLSEAPLMLLRSIRGLGSNRNLVWLACIPLAISAWKFRRTSFFSWLFLRLELRATGVKPTLWQKPDDIGIRLYVAAGRSRPHHLVWKQSGWQSGCFAAD